MFGDLAQPVKENLCVTKDGEILALSLKDGVFTYENGAWVKPKFKVFGDTIMDARPITDEEFAVLSESLKSTFGND